MSKHCEVCNRSYPDDLAACPHCEEAVEVLDEDVVELEEEAPEEAVPAAPLADEPDSAVDLGLPTVSADPHGGSGARPGAGSGLSFIEWASLVEEQPSAASASPATFDDPSDTELKRHVPDAGAEAPPPPPMGTEATLALPPVHGPEEDALASDLEAVRTIFSGDVSASFARRGPTPEPEPKPESRAQPPEDDDSALDLFSPGGGEASGVEVVPEAKVVGSGIDLAAEPVAEGASGAHGIEAVDSGIDLVGADLEEEVVAEAVEAPPSAVGADSGIDLAGLMADEPAPLEIVDSGVNLADLAGFEEAPVAEVAAPTGDSGIDLGEVQVVDGSSSGGHSALLVVDSGVDLVGPDLGDELSPAEPRAEAPVVRPISDAGLDLTGEDAVGGPSGPLSGIEKNSPDTSESGRDLIAEEVESGINLDLPLQTVAAHPSASSDSGADKIDEIADESATTLAAGQLASEAEEVDLNEMSTDGVDSSAIDLGASAAFPAAPPEAASGLPDLESTRPFGGKLESIHGEEEAVDPSEVNLGGRHDEAAEDYFEESTALVGSGAPLNMAEDESPGLTVDEEAVDQLEEGAPEPVSEEEEEAPEEEPAPRGRGRKAPKAPKAPKEKSRSTAGGWVGGMVLGGVVVAGVLAGLWVFGVEPPKEWRPFAPAATPPTSPNGVATGPGPGPGPVAAGAATPADKVKWAQSGDPDATQKAAIEAADETNPKEVAARGEFRVRDYLKQQAAGGKVITADDDAMKKALADLEKEKDADPDALFYLGVAKEAVKDYDAALTAYQTGAADPKADAAQKERCEAGVDRVKAKKDGGMGRAEPAADDAAALAVLLTALEPAQPPAPLAGDKPAFTEAGAAFWYAMGKADAGDYGAAVDALNQADKIHLQQRFTRLGKAQNPNSDPLEDIFPRSCKELEAYWDKLRTSTLPIVKGKDPAKALTDLLAEDQDLTDQLVKTKTESEEAKKGLEMAKKEVEDAKKDAETSKKGLEAATKELDAAKVDLEAKTKDLKAAEKKADDMTADLKAAKEDAAKKDETLKSVAGALTPMFLKPEADKDVDLLNAVKKTAELAAITDPKGEMGALTDALNKVAEELKPLHLAPNAEKGALAPAVKKVIDDLATKTDVLNKIKALKPNHLASGADDAALVPAVEKAIDGLAQRWTPEQMLTLWMPLLRERGRKDLAKKALDDADRVVNDEAATPEAKARAHVVKGMALRDLENYPAARTELEQANANLPKEDGEWRLETEIALADAADPSAFFVGKAEEFRKQGRAAEATAMLTRGLETAGPQTQGRLLIERGALHLEQALAHGNGRVAANDPDVVAARSDADEAEKGGAAEAFYLSGRINEALGQTDAAVQDYRQALSAHGALDAEGARYRAALARLLMLPRPAKVGLNGQSPALEMLAALVAVGLQPGDLPGQTDPATAEALKLADEILSTKDATFEARARAYAIKGLWTQALTTYAEGLRSRLSPEDADGLMAIINGHPALRRPTLLVVADPLEAEKHYAAGLRWYNVRQYDKAEKEFFTAVEQDGQDARYYYYLGLAHLMQGDRDAYEDFEQGARLERQNRPPHAAVSAALERVQGEARQQLNDVRDRPR